MRRVAIYVRISFVCGLKNSVTLKDILNDMIL